MTIQIDVNYGYETSDSGRTKTPVVRVTATLGEFSGGAAEPMGSTVESGHAAIDAAARGAREALARKIDDALARGEAARRVVQGLT